MTENCAVALGRIRLGIAICLVAASATRLDAQDVRQKIERRCSQELGQRCVCDRTALEMTLCARLHYEYADSVLAVVYREARESVDANDLYTDEILVGWKKALDEAQETWLRFRDADCGIMRDFEWRGGSGADGARWSCLLAHTEQRIADLRERY